VEITKEVLQHRVAGMTEQLGVLLEQASQVRGAINVCNELIKHLERPEPDKNEGAQETA